MKVKGLTITHFLNGFVHYPFPKWTCPAYIFGAVH